MYLCDAKNHYLYNTFIYCRKSDVPNIKKFVIPTLNLLELVTYIFNSNKNIIGNNWFSSIELIIELKWHGLTYVGVLRKKKEIYYQKLFLKKKLK